MFSLGIKIGGTGMERICGTGGRGRLGGIGDNYFFFLIGSNTRPAARMSMGSRIVIGATA